MGITGVDPTFLAFLERLGNKKEGEPLINWQESLDFLIVFIGDGDCRQYALGGWAAPFLDIVCKLYPRGNDDSFVGFEISGGIRTFLRCHYKEILGEKYEEFKIRHNTMHHEYHASELFEMWLIKFPATEPDQIAQIRKALRQQNPTIHIPL